MNKINLYGFGKLGKSFYEYAKSNNLEIMNIFDKNQCGNFVDQIEIILPKDSIDRDFPVIITILTETVDIDIVKNELLSMGYKNVMNLIEALHTLNIRNFEHFFVSHPDLYKDDIVKENIKIVKNRLSDNLSLSIFDEIIYSRKNGNFKKLNGFTQKDNHYLPDFIKNELIKLESINVLDMGACYGDLIKFFKQKNIEISNYIGFEPDINNINELKLNLEQNNINGLIYPIGVADFNGLVGFDSNKGVSSTINYSSNDKIMVCKIDDIISYKIDFVKMDIEGFEKEALSGMKELITKNKPILAISIYHKPLDFIDIPILLMENYQNIYIRYHEKNGFELVVYAF